MSGLSVLRDSYTCRISDMVKTIIWSLTDSISEHFLNPAEIVILADFLKPVKTGNWSGCILKQTMGSVVKSKGKKYFLLSK